MSGREVEWPVARLKSQALTTRPVISLSEGSDPRIVAGALAARREGIADVILVGDTAQVQDALHRQNATPGGGLTLMDPKDAPLCEEFAARFYDMRKHKGLDRAGARAACETPLVFAAMLVATGRACGTLGGAVHTTSDVVRTALQVIGVAPDAGMVSGFFLMFPPENAPAPARAMLFADCGLVIDPSASDLVQIARQSANSARALMHITPRIAMLSFSTKGSACHPKVSKMAEATAALRAAHPDLDVDGELQFDAAFLPEIAGRKAPGSSVAGHANVMIFPDLDAGNIAYKITQRIGGYAAIGPVLQGLAQPANDLSRGCSAEDVTQMIAVTALQA